MDRLRKLFSDFQDDCVTLGTSKTSDKIWRISVFLESQRLPELWSSGRCQFSSG